MNINPLPQILDPPPPVNIKYSQYIIIYYKIGMFNIRGVGSLILAGGENSHLIRLDKRVGYRDQP